jgi:hypothetical protein
MAQIVASFASFGALSITVKAGGAAAALAGSRWFVPLAGTAAGADVVQLVALTDITFTELNKIQNGAGTPEDKQRAMAVLLTQLIVASGLTALSVQGARNIRAMAGRPLEVVDQNGVKVLRVVGEPTPEPVGAPKTAAADTQSPSSGTAPKPTEHADHGSATDTHGPASGTGSEAGTPSVRSQEAQHSDKAPKTKEPTPKSEGGALSENRSAMPVRKPASRHTLRKVSQTSVAKDLNTVVEPRIDVAKDVEAINEGKAVAGMTGDGIRTYTVNGRTYGMEAGGTLFPMTGDGFILLNRNAYKILGIFNKFGDTPRAFEIIELQRPSAKFTDADVENALNAWRAGQDGAHE